MAMLDGAGWPGGVGLAEGCLERCCWAYFSLRLRLAESLLRFLVSCDWTGMACGVVGLGRPRYMKMGLCVVVSFGLRLNVSWLKSQDPWSRGSHPPLNKEGRGTIPQQSLWAHGCDPLAHRGVAGKVAGVALAGAGHM